MVNWQLADVAALFEAAGLSQLQTFRERLTSKQPLSGEHIARWFATTATTPRPTYGQHLHRAGFTSEEVVRVQQLFSRQLAGQTIRWPREVGYLVAERQ